jgi:hypothetical protein
MEIKNHCSSFFLSEKLKSLGLPNLAQASQGKCLACFQSSQQPSTQAESPHSLKCHVSFKVCTQL